MGIPNNENVMNYLSFFTTAETTDTQIYISNLELLCGDYDVDDDVYILSSELRWIFSPTNEWKDVWWWRV